MAVTAGIVGLDPTSGPLKIPDGSPARRRDSIDGAVVGLVANGLGESEALMQAIYEELSNYGDLAGAVPVLKHSVSIPPEPGDWARLTSEATVGVTGFGG
jgi:hypothetical protein